MDHSTAATDVGGTPEQLGVGQVGNARNGSRLLREEEEQLGVEAQADFLYSFFIHALFPLPYFLFPFG